MLRLPLHGACPVRNSPADPLPSHGTDESGSACAIDLSVAAEE